MLKATDGKLWRAQNAQVLMGHGTLKKKDKELFHFEWIYQEMHFTKIKEKY